MITISQLKKRAKDQGFPLNSPQTASALWHLPRELLTFVNGPLTREEVGASAGLPQSVGGACSCQRVLVIAMPGGLVTTLCPPAQPHVVVADALCVLQATKHTGRLECCGSIQRQRKPAFILNPNEGRIMLGGRLLGIIFKLAFICTVLVSDVIHSGTNQAQYMYRKQTNYGWWLQYSKGKADTFTATLQPSQGHSHLVQLACNNKVSPIPVSSFLLKTIDKSMMTVCLLIPTIYILFATIISKPCTVSLQKTSTRHTMFYLEFSFTGYSNEK